MKKYYPKKLLTTSKFLQSKLDEIKKTYGEAIKDLEGMAVVRPPKPVAAAPAAAPETPAEPAPAAVAAPAPVAATA